MPVQTRYTDEGKGVILTLSGELTGRDVLTAYHEMHARDLAAQPFLYGLVDANGVTAMNVRTQDLYDIANQDIAAARRRGSTVAVVGIYAKDDATFGLARMWEVLVAASGWDTGVFRERSEAVAWLKQHVAVRFGIAPSLE
jgi:hypothetical protein